MRIINIYKNHKRVVLHTGTIVGLFGLILFLSTGCVGVGIIGSALSGVFSIICFILLLLGVGITQPACDAFICLSIVPEDSGDFEDASMDMDAGSDGSISSIQKHLCLSINDDDSDFHSKDTTPTMDDNFLTYPPSKKANNSLNTERTRIIERLEKKGILPADVTKRLS